MFKRNRTKGQSTIYKTLHIKLLDRAIRTPLHSGAPEGYVVSASLETPVVLLQLQSHE
jgi:hypothetical protein